MTTALVCSEKKGKFDFTCTFQHVQSMTRKWTFYPRINQRHLSTSKCLTKLLILLQENRKLERGWRGKPLWVTHCLKNDMSLIKKMPDNLKLCGKLCQKRSTWIAAVPRLDIDIIVIMGYIAYLLKRPNLYKLHYFI